MKKLMIIFLLLGGISFSVEAREIKVGSVNGICNSFNDAKKTKELIRDVFSSKKIDTGEIELYYNRSIRDGDNNDQLCKATGAAESFWEKVRSIPSKDDIFRSVPRWLENRAKYNAAYMDERQSQVAWEIARNEFLYIKDVRGEKYEEVKKAYQNVSAQAGKKITSFQDLIDYPSDFMAVGILAIIKATDLVTADIFQGFTKKQQKNILHLSKVYLQAIEFTAKTAQDVLLLSLTEDLENMERDIRAKLDAGNGVILFCHSQGTIICHELTEKIQSDFLQTIYIAPAIGESNEWNNGRYVKFENDILDNIFVGLDANVGKTTAENPHSVSAYLQDQKTLPMILGFYQEAQQKIENYFQWYEKAAKAKKKLLDQEVTREKVAADEKKQFHEKMLRAKKKLIQENKNNRGNQ